MPFLPVSLMPTNAEIIDETTYENPEDPTDTLTLYIRK